MRQGKVTCEVGVLGVVPGRSRKCGSERTYEGRGGRGTKPMGILKESEGLRGGRVPARPGCKERTLARALPTVGG